MPKTPYSDKYPNRPIAMVVNTFDPTTRRWAQTSLCAREDSRSRIFGDGIPVAWEHADAPEGATLANATDKWYRVTMITALKNWGSDVEPPEKTVLACQREGGAADFERWLDEEPMVRRNKGLS